MGWVTKLDNTFWSDYASGTWSPGGHPGVWYDAVLNTPDFDGFQAIGGWNVGYTPTQIRLTLSASVAVGLDVILNPGGSQQMIGNAAVTTTPTAFTFTLPSFPLTGGGGDLVYLEVDTDAFASGTRSLTWHNIEFFEAAPPGAFWKDNVKCTETD